MKKRIINWDCLHAVFQAVTYQRCRFTTYAILVKFSYQMVAITVVKSFWHHVQIFRVQYFRRLIGKVCIFLGSNACWLLRSLGNLYSVWQKILLRLVLSETFLNNFLEYKNGFYTDWPIVWLVLFIAFLVQTCYTCALRTLIGENSFTQTKNNNMRIERFHEISCIPYGLYLKAINTSGTAIRYIVSDIIYLPHFYLLIWILGHS